MANTLEFAKLFQSSLDAQIQQVSTTGWMEANASQVKYNGGKEIKIPKMTLDGLADYDKTTGHTAGDVTLAWETKTMTKDRGRKFSIDAMDVDETNFVATATNVMNEFQRTQVVPEIDSYRLSALYANALTDNKRDITLTAANALTELLNDIAKAYDAGATNLKIHLTESTINLLSQSPQWAGVSSTNALSAGVVESRVTVVNGATLIPTAPARLKTAYTFTNGFAPAAGAKDILWLIVDAQAPIAVSKQDVVRIFDP